MNGADYLSQFSHTLKTTMGACFPGDKVIFRGKTLHKDLQDIEWFDLFLFGITGRRFDKNQLTLLQTIWTYTSYPDARIWNNRVAGLAGSNRSTSNLAISAALAISEAEIFGRGIDIKAITFLINSNIKIKTGTSLAECVNQELKTNRGIAGYGRPLVSADERIAPIMETAKRLELANGPHVRLALAVDNFLVSGRWRLKLNYGAISAALAADMGLTTQEYCLFSIPAFSIGMFPCYIEAANKPAGTLFPTACHDIDYTGQAARQWPPACGYKQD
jgi:hypothetical protein